MPPGGMRDRLAGRSQATRGAEGSPRDAHRGIQGAPHGIRRARCPTRGSHHSPPGSHRRTLGSHRRTLGSHHRTLGSHYRTLGSQHKTRGSHHTTHGSHYKIHGSQHRTPGSRRSTRGSNDALALRCDARSGSGGRRRVLCVAGAGRCVASTVASVALGVPGVSPEARGLRGRTTGCPTLVSGSVRQIAGGAALQPEPALPLQLGATSTDLSCWRWVVSKNSMPAGHSASRQRLYCAYSCCVMLLATLGGKRRAANL